MKEEVRLQGIEEKIKNNQDKHREVLLMGASNHIASHILAKFLDAIPGAHITLQDTKDPSVAFWNPKIKVFKGTSRCSLIQSSPYDWDWLKNDYQKYDTIINCLYVHDAVYCKNNPMDSVYRNPVAAMNFMNVLTSGSGYDGKLLIMSTDKVYGQQDKYPTPENVECKPEGVRATTRYAMEQIQRGIALENGIKHMVLRLGTTYGEWMPREKCVYSWCRKLLLHEPLLLNGEFSPDDSPWRDFINYKDVAALAAFVSITDWSNEQKNEIYNIGKGDSQPRKLWNVAEGMKSVLWKGTNTIRAPWREGSEKNLRIWMDTAKAQSKLLWLPGEELIYGATRYLAPWIAFHDLMWTEDQIVELKKSLGIRDAFNSSGVTGAAKPKFRPESEGSPMKYGHLTV